MVDAVIGSFLFVFVSVLITFSILYMLNTLYSAVRSRNHPFLADILLLQHNTVRFLHSSGDQLYSPGSHEVLEMDYLDFRHVFLGEALKFSASRQLFWQIEGDWKGKKSLSFGDRCLK